MSAEYTQPTLYHRTYTHLNSIEAWLPTISMGVAAFACGGWTAGLVGLGFGLADLAAQHYGVYQRSYLTTGMLGYTFLGRIKVDDALPLVNDRINLKLLGVPTLTALIVTRNVIGFLGGIIITQVGIDGENSNALSTISGAFLNGIVLAGPRGGALGLVGGITDTMLSKYNITKKNWFSSVISGGGVSSLLCMHTLRLARHATPNSFIRSKAFLTHAYSFISNRPVAKALPGIAIMTAYNAFSAESPPEHSLTVELYHETKAIFAEVMPKGHLDNFFEKHYIVAVSAQLIIQFITIRLSEDKQKVNEALNSKAWARFYANFKGAPIILITFLSMNHFRGLTTSYFMISPRYALEDRIRSQLFKGESLLKLTKALGADEANSLIQSYEDDIKSVTTCASLATKTLTKAIAGGHAGLYLSSINAADMILATAIYSKATNFISISIASNQKIHNKNLTKLEAHYTSLSEYARTNAVQLTQENNLLFLEQNLEKSVFEYRKLEEASKMWELVASSWESFLEWSNYLFSILMAGIKMADGSLAFSNWVTTTYLTGDILALMRTEGVNAATVIQGNISLFRLKKLMSVMHAADIHNNTLTNYGEGYSVRRIVNQQGPRRLCFQSLTIGVGERNNILTRADSTCVQGNTIVITGDSGGGKTTTLAVIKGIQYSEAWGNGTIVFGGFNTTCQYLRIQMMSQNSNIPMNNNITYLEYVTSSIGDAAQTKRDSVAQLMNQLKIDAGSNDSISDSLDNFTASRQLSGGQKKKLAIVQLIIKGCGDVVILDEPFSGMDINSVKSAQEVLGKHCQDSMKLVVDHNFQGHNTTGFYDGHLHFSNTTKTISAVTGRYDSSTEIEAPIQTFLDSCGELSGALAVSCPYISSSLS